MQLYTFHYTFCRYDFPNNFPWYEDVLYILKLLTHVYADASNYSLSRIYPMQLDSLNEHKNTKLSRTFKDLTPRSSTASFLHIDPPAKFSSHIRHPYPRNFSKHNPAAKLARQLTGWLSALLSRPAAVCLVI